MKSGMLAAEVIIEAQRQGELTGVELTSFNDAFEKSWLYEELDKDKSYGAALHKWGLLLGGAYNFLNQNIFAGKLPAPRDIKFDHEQLLPADQCEKINYPKPDGILSFDRLSSVALSNTFHEEDQPAHLTLNSADIPIQVNLEKFDAPEQRYCPAGVYEIVQSEEGDNKLQINAQNCVHCKTCDIKDPTQNIVWVTPEGAGGPNYSSM